MGKGLGNLDLGKTPGTGKESKSGKGFRKSGIVTGLNLVFYYLFLFYEGVTSLLSLKALVKNSERDLGSNFDNPKASRGYGGSWLFPGWEGRSFHFFPMFPIFPIFPSFPSFPSSSSPLNTSHH